MRKIINPTQYQQIVGLLTVAGSLNQQLRTIENTLLELTGEAVAADELGHCADAVGITRTPAAAIRNADDLLNFLNISIVAE